MFFPLILLWIYVLGKENITRKVSSWKTKERKVLIFNKNRVWIYGYEMNYEQMVFWGNEEELRHKLLSWKYGTVAVETFKL